MLEAINLSKIYKPKKGVPVRALDGINLKFPETGMVFLLGKSGSGKSTMLNVLGGLDKYDEGEIVIKGVSSKNFKQADFDSYRNTYVGFIFQEYNILEEFTVGANIGLALELQGKKATDERVNAILEEVDLEGYGARRPNELSGGQKQRVAIARALVKNPEIIFADEPTGALDSATGKQVLQTLKKLSSDKLVVVVSHDREFAEGYADRIIELADGRVISDVALAAEGETAEAVGDTPGKKTALVFAENSIEVPQGYHLTEEDRQSINAYLDGLMGSAVITKGEKSKKFKATDASAIKKSVSGTPFKLIKSRLPLKNAFRIGAGALKHKKVRLVFTVILSFVAFTLFGLSDLFSDYDNIRTCANSIMDTGITYASVTKSVKMRYDDYSYWDSYNRKLSDEDIAAITGKTGVAMTGVYSDDYMSLSFNSNFDANVKLSETNYTIHANRFSGFTEMTMADLTAMGYNLAAGSLPDGGRDEIAVSVYVCETFIKAGYSDGTSQNYIKINSYSDMVGKTLNLNGKNYMITGVIDTHFNFDRYLPLTKLNPNADNAKMLINYALYTEYSEENAYSFCAVAFTGKGFAKKQGLAENGAAIRDGSVYFTKAADSQYQFNLYSERLARLSDIDASKVIWLDGERETLGKKEIIIYSDSVYAYSNDSYPIEIKNMTEFLKENGSVVANISKYRTGENIIEDDWKIVGYIETPVAQIKQSAVVCGDWLYDMFAEESGGAYGFAVGVMPETYNGITGLLKFCYNESGDVRYPMRNAVVYELDNVKMILEQLSKVFLYIGLFFAFFASVLLATFIASSVAYKKQDIGILRAIGSRSNDVFRIFFSESFVIAFTNFVLSALGTLLAAVWINVSIRNNTGLLITVLSFGIRQLALLFVISMGVAFVASFLPVRKIAAKKPIDAIRNR